MPSPSDDCLDAAIQCLRDAAAAVDTDGAFWAASIDAEITNYGRAVAKRAAILLALQQVQHIRHTHPLAAKASANRAVPCGGNNNTAARV